MPQEIYHWLVHEDPYSFCVILFLIWFVIRERVGKSSKDSKT